MRPDALVVLQPAWLGDLVFTSPLTRALAAAYPGLPVHLVCRRGQRALGELLPGVTAVHEFDKRGRDAGLAGLWRTARRIRAAAGARLRVCCAHPSTRSWLLARALAPGAASRAPPGITAGTNLVDRILAAAPELRAPDRRLSLRRPALAPAAAPYAVIVLGSQWPTKRWPAAEAGRLARLLRERRGLVVRYLGGPDDAPLAADAATHDGGAGDASALAAPLADALALLAGATLVVGPDTGFTHAARAFDVPTLAVFGPTSPAAHHRQGPRDRLFALALACSPCGTHGARRCPLGHHRCLRELDAERAFAALP